MSSCTSYCFFSSKRSFLILEVKLRLLWAYYRAWFTTAVVKYFIAITLSTFYWAYLKKDRLACSYILYIFEPSLSCLIHRMIPPYHVKDYQFPPVLLHYRFIIFCLLFDFVTVNKTLIVNDDFVLQLQVL